MPHFVIQIWKKQDGDNLLDTYNKYGDRQMIKQATNNFGWPLAREICHHYLLNESIRMGTITSG